MVEGSVTKGEPTLDTAAPSSLELNVPEHILFAKSLNERVTPFCEQVSAVSKNLYALKGVSTSTWDVASLDRTNTLL